MVNESQRLFSVEVHILVNTVCGVAVTISDMLAVLIVFLPASSNHIPSAFSKQVNKFNGSYKIISQMF